MWQTTARRLAAIGFACMLSAACSPDSSGGDSSPDSLKAMVVPGIGSAFTLRVDTAQGIDAASRAASADPVLAHQAMMADGFKRGWARTWVSGPEDVEVLVFEVEDQFKARDLAHFEIDQLTKGTHVTPYPDDQVPGSAAYTFVGRTRVGLRQVFCQGAWFALAQFAFNITDCSDTPRYPQLMMQVTRAQYERAAAQLGLVPAPLVSAAPSAGP